MLEPERVGRLEPEEGCQERKRDEAERRDERDGESEERTGEHVR